MWQEHKGHGLCAVSLGWVSMVSCEPRGSETGWTLMPHLGV